MRTVVKKWGNGLAVRLPRNSPDFGPLREGAPVEIHVRAIRHSEGWSPLVLPSPIPNPSQHVDEIRLGRFDRVLSRRGQRGRR